VAVDPLGSGLVARLARPGGQCHGPVGPVGRPCRQTTQNFALASSQSPPTRDHGQCWLSRAVLEMDETQAAARMLGINTNTLEIRHAEDIASGIDELRDRADALYVCTDALINANHVRINTLALGTHLPTMHGPREHVAREVSCPMEQLPRPVSTLR
jgi:putative tryptophan/tyrosine transport system substrate-binding protein